VTDDAQQPVPLGDLEVAQRIAGAARSGSRADREPSIEHLLSAFGEDEPTPEARTRIASALRLAGLSAKPSLHEAHPGERIALRLEGGARRSARALLGAGLLVLVLAGAAVAAALSGGGDGDGGRAADALPATTQTTATAPASTATTPPTTATTAPASTKQKPAKRKKKRAAPKPQPKGVTVRLVPGPQASYLCVDHGPGTAEIETTLSAPQTFKGKRVRLNVGLSSVSVTVNGKPFALSGSPTGYDLTRTKRTFLPQGQRPCA
jgi:hypothetical protein